MRIQEVFVKRKKDPNITEVHTHTQLHKCTHGIGKVDDGSSHLFRRRPNLSRHRARVVPSFATIADGLPQAGGGRFPIHFPAMAAAIVQACILG